MASVLAVFQVLLSIGLCTLILLHSGRDTGLGGMMISRRDYCGRS